MTVSGKGSIIDCNFNPPIDVSDNCEIGLLSLHTWNTMPNIDESNNVIVFSKPGQEPVLTVTLPVGTYEVDDLNSFIAKEYRKIAYVYTVIEKDKDVKMTSAFKLQVNHTTLHCEITCGHPIDFTRPKSFCRLLGFNPRHLEPYKINISDYNVAISSITSIRVDCNVIAGSYHNGTQSHTLHEFSPTVAPGYRIIEVPRQIVYYPLNTNVLDTIRIALRNQEGHTVNLQDEELSVRLHIKHK